MTTAVLRAFLFLYTVNVHTAVLIGTSEIFYAITLCCANYKRDILRNNSYAKLMLTVSSSSTTSSISYM